MEDSDVCFEVRFVDSMLSISEEPEVVGEICSTASPALESVKPIEFWGAAEESIDVSVIQSSVTIPRPRSGNSDTLLLYCVSLCCASECASTFASLDEMLSDATELTDSDELFLDAMVSADEKFPDAMVSVDGKPPDAAVAVDVCVSEGSKAAEVGCNLFSF